MAKETLYIRNTGRPQERGVVALALQASDDAAPITISGLAVSWTPQGLFALRDVWRDAARRYGDGKRSLPYASLRGLLEVMVPEVSRIDRRMGLDPYALRKETQPVTNPFLWTEGGDAPVRNALEKVVGEWLPNYLVETFAKPGGVDEKYVNRVYELHRAGNLLATQVRTSQVLPWKWSKETGTTLARNPATDFAVMADHAARLLAGRKLFPELGPLRRILVAYDASAGTAELMTDPIPVDGKGDFSLLLRLEVVTFPATHQPVLRVDVSKRRWLRGLDDDAFAHGSVSGYTFPASAPDRAPGFSLVRRRGADGNYFWEPDNAFHALKRHYELPLERLDADSIARGLASTEMCAVRIAHRYGLSDRGTAVKAGVPEVDKLDAFEAIASALAPHGLRRFDAFAPVDTEHRSRSDAARMINPPTLLGAALEWDDIDDDGDGDRELTAEYISTLGEEELDRLLRERFRLGLASIQHGDRIANFQDERGAQTKDQGQELLRLVSENADAVRRLYGTKRPQLAILYDEREGDALKLLQAVVRVLWGDALDVKISRLPKDVHGPRNSLPGPSDNALERSRLRVEAWRPVAESIKKSGRTTLCLVMAPDFYADRDSGRAKPDDKVNKPAARKALATIAGGTVQYLLPPRRDRDGATRLTDFFHRVQAALKDLISAHAGRIDGVAEAVGRCFGMTETAPREVIGITIVRRNSGRQRTGLDKTFLPVAFRLDVATGRCDVRYACERSGRLYTSDWHPFSCGLAEIAGVSPVQLAAEQRERRTRFMQFCETVVTESVDSGAQPLVVIDSSNCSKLWSWLTDTKINTANIEVCERQWMQENWQGARIVRIRQELAPGMLIDKVLELTPASDAGTSRPKRRPIQLRLPSSPTAGTLFRLGAQSENGCVTYLSVGGKTLHQHKRGLSCYRYVRVAVHDTGSTATSGERLFRIQERGPSTDQWPTPNPIEIVVSLRQAGDSPDRLAEFIESLRYGFGHYGEWTSLPAPLFFERVVRDYISGFALADDEEAAEAEVT